MPSDVWIHHIWYNVWSSIKYWYFSNTHLFFVVKCSKCFLLAHLKQSPCVAAVFVPLLHENTSASFLCQPLRHRNESLRHCWYLAVTSVVNRDLDPLWHFSFYSCSHLRHSWMCLLTSLHTLFWSEELFCWIPSFFLPSLCLFQRKDKSFTRMSSDFPFYAPFLWSIHFLFTVSTMTGMICV